MRRWLMLPWLLCLTLLSAAQGGLYNIPQPFTESVSSGSTIALTRAGRILSTQPLTDTVSLIGLDNTLDAQFDLPGAGGVVILPGNLRALAVGTAQILDINLSDNTAQPLLDSGGAYIVANSTVAYVSQPDRAQILEINLENPDRVQVIETAPHPTGLALWGDFLYVTHFQTGQFSLIYRPTRDVVRTIQPAANARLAESIALDSIAGVAYLPLSRSNPATDAPDNRFVPLVAVIDLRTLQTTRLINLIVADRYVNYPTAAALNQNRTQLAIAHAGSDSVTVLNLEDEIAVAHLQTDAAPHGVAYNAGFTRLYVPSRVESTVTVHDTRFFALEDVLPATDRLTDPLLRLGTRLYYQGNPHISCMTCHFQNAVRVSDAPDAPQSVTEIALSSQFLATHYQSAPLPDVDVQALVTYLQAQQTTSAD